MDLDECKRKGFIKPTRKNISLVNSLVEVSELKMETVNKAVIDEKSITAYVPMAYDALREVLEALCILKGYKITNHICIGSFLKSLFSDFDLVSFDRFRYVRNGINYYGKKIGLDEGNEIIKSIFLLRKKILERIKNER
tara:strand:+ start:5100 stop:5516 length:417 start_codon:yes stop_codon:yes gene_type:complete